jgi:hypothetical protein
VEAGLCMLCGVPVPGRVPQQSSGSPQAGHRQSGRNGRDSNWRCVELSIGRFRDLPSNANAERARKDAQVAGMLHGRPDTNWRCVELSIGRFRDRRPNATASPRIEGWPKSPNRPIGAR